MSNDRFGTRPRQIQHRGRLQQVGGVAYATSSYEPQPTEFLEGRQQ